MKNYYAVLGIPFGANEQDIKKAYHRLAHIHHPDKGGDEAKFKEINEAYLELKKIKNQPIQPIQYQWEYSTQYYYATKQYYYATNTTNR